MSQAIQALESMGSGRVSGKRAALPPFGSLAAREPARWVDPNICSSDELADPLLFGHSGTVAQLPVNPVSSEYPPVHKRSDRKYWLTGPNVSPAHRTANLKKWPGAHYPLHVYRLGGVNPPPYCGMSLVTRPDPTRLASQQTTPLVAAATTRNSAYHTETADQRSIPRPGANGLTLCLHTLVRSGSRCTVSAICKTSRTIATHGALRLQTSRGCHGRTPVTLTRRSPLSWMATFGSSTAPTGSLTLAPPRLTANNG